MQPQIEWRHTGWVKTAHIPVPPRYLSTSCTEYITRRIVGCMQLHDRINQLLDCNLGSKISSAEHDLGGTINNECYMSVWRSQPTPTIHSFRLSAPIFFRNESGPRKIGQNGIGSQQKGPYMNSKTQTYICTHPAPRLHKYGGHTSGSPDCSNHFYTI